MTQAQCNTASGEVAKWYVLARPRSRTTWLTALLKRLDVDASHDFSCEVSSLDQLERERPQVVIDTALAVHWKALNGPMVVIDNPVERCVRSLQLECNTEPSTIFYAVDKAISQLSKYVPVITADDLSDYVACKQLIKLISGKDLSRELHKQFVDTYITVDIHEEMERFKARAQNIISLYGDYLV